MRTKHTGTAQNRPRPAAHGLRTRVGAAIAALGVSVVALVALRPDAASAATTVTPRVTCAVTTPTGRTVWFGYRNTSSAPELAPAGVSGNTFSLEPQKLAPTNLAAVAQPNAVAALTPVAVVAPNQGQVDQFLPGVHPMAFAVALPGGSDYQWTLFGSTVHTSGTLAACPAGTPTGSATVQSTVSGGGSISAILATNPSTGAKSVKFAVANLSTRCTSGTALAPATTWAYNEAKLVNVAPLPAAQTEGSVAYSASYATTSSPTRSIISSTKAASVQVIADVVGRCQLASGQVVAATSPYWLAADGSRRQAVYQPSTGSVTVRDVPVVCETSAALIGPGTSTTGGSLPCPIGGGSYMR